MVVQEPVALMKDLTALAGRTYTFACHGSTVSNGVTELPLAMDDGDVSSPGDGMLGVPVCVDMSAFRVAVSWISDNAPAEDWTLTLYRRTVGGTFSAVATFTVTTS